MVTYWVTIAAIAGLITLLVRPLVLAVGLAVLVIVWGRVILNLVRS